MSFNPALMAVLWSGGDAPSARVLQLYFQNGRKYASRSYGGLCLSMSIVAVIVAVIGIVSVAAYLGGKTLNWPGFRRGGVVGALCSAHC